MLFVGSFFSVGDNSGLILVTCIKILGNIYNKSLFIGDLIIISIKKIKTKTYFFQKKKRRLSTFCSGSVHRVFIIRTRKNFMRALGAFIAFSENSVILVNKKNVPLARRIKGPVPMEICLRFPTLGHISQYII